MTWSEMATSEHKDRIYTQDNNKLAEYLGRAVRDTGKFVELVGSGEILLWLNIRDALNRIILHDKPNSTAQNQQKGHVTTRNRNLYG